MISTSDPADDAGRCRDDPVVTDLVARARAGDQQAWDALVERYAPLIWSICRRYGLGGADAEDAGQSVWLKLVGQLGSIREPAALPGWLATTTRRECARIMRAAPGPRDAGYLHDPRTVPDDYAEVADQLLLEAERHAALRQALADLPACCQQLIALLAGDPPLIYAEISVRLGIPVGSIGPIRRRCLDRLRRHPAITALIDADADAALAIRTSDSPENLPHKAFPRKRHERGCGRYSARRLAPPPVLWCAS
jgi:RNA polymerase sigma factor (sigma-70 family)